MTIDCTGGGDASNFRNSGCLYSGDDCPIAGKKTKTGLEMKFFAEQVMDGKQQWRDEMFHLYNPASPNASAVPGYAQTKNLRDRQNVHDGHADAEEFINREPKAAKNDRAEWCSQSGGKLIGIGPSCDVGERGQADLHHCVFDKIKECESRRQLCRGDKISYQNMVSQFQGNVDAAQPPIGNAQICDEYYKECVETSTSICVCGDCQFGYCINDCDDDDPTDPNDPTDPSNPTTDTDYDIGPRLKQLDFTNSAYDITIPLVYGRYVLPGNIIWASDVIETSITETTETVDGDRTRVNVRQRFAYHGSIALGLCAGPISGLLRVWMGEALLFSRTISVDEAGNVEPTDGILVDEIENMVLFSAGSDDEVVYDSSRMRITLFNGAEDQLPAAAFGTGAPAYRGLAYLLFENVNVGYLGGRIPEFRVEVTQTLNATTQMPRSITTLTVDDFEGARTDLLLADIRSNSLYIASDPAPSAPTVKRGIRKLRLDTLEEISAYYDADEDIDMDTVFVFKNGVLGYQRDGSTLQRATVFIRPETNTVLTTLGTDVTTDFDYTHTDTSWGLLSPATWTGDGLLSADNGNDDRMYTADLVIPVSRALYVETATFDEATASLQRASAPTSAYDPYYTCYLPCVSACADTWCTSGGGEGEEGGGPFDCSEPDYSDCLDECDSGCFTLSDTPYPFASIQVDKYTLDDTDTTAPVYTRAQYLDIFALPTSAQPQMNIVRAKYTDTSGYTENAVVIDPIPIPEVIAVPASVWGGQTSGMTGSFVYHDRARNQAVVFIMDGSGGAHSFALSIADDYSSVNWYTYLPSFEMQPSPGVRILPYPTDAYNYVAHDGNIYALDLNGGDLTILGTLTGEALPGYGGIQLYDPGRNSITYISDETTPRVVRVYPQRVIAAPAYVGEIIADIAQRAGIPAHQIDVSDIADYTITGLLLASNTKPSAAIQQLVNMFNLSVWEQDGLLYVKKRATGDDFDLHERDFIGDNVSYVRTEADPYIEPKKLTFAYADIDNFCREAQVMVSHQITAEHNLYALGHVKLQTAAALDLETAGEVADRYFTKLHTRTDTLRFSMLALHNRMSPNDYINVTFNDVEAERYQIKEVIVDPVRSRVTIEAERDTSYLDAENAALVPWEDPNKYKVQREFRRLAALTIRTFFVTPYTETDMLASTTHHVVYGGVQTDEETIDVTGLAVRVMNGEERIHEKATTIGAPLQLGRLLTTLPDDLGIFDTDDVTELQVRFRRSDVEPLLVSATQAEILADRTKNVLLVGREWIQFKNVSYDSLSRTATFTGLLRGRNGSDIYVPTHSIGEEVVLPTVESFRPMYIHYLRMSENDSISVRLTSMQSVQVSGKPVIFASNNDSIRPWAPTNIDRWVSNVVPTNIVITFNYRGKHDGELQDNDVPTFEPTPEIFGEFRDPRMGSYSRRYVLYFTRHQFGVPAISEVEGMMKQREENNAGVWAGYSRVEANNDAEATFPSSAFSGISYNSSLHTLYVYVAQLGGPSNNKLGFVTRAVFPPGTYPALPLGPKMRLRKGTAYAVLSPDNLKVYDAGVMLVLKP